MANLNSFSVYLLNKEDYTQYKDLVVDGVKTKTERVEKFKKLLEMTEEYKRKNQYV